MTFNVFSKEERRLKYLKTVLIFRQLEQLAN